MPTLQEQRKKLVETLVQYVKQYLKHNPSTSIESAIEIVMEDKIEFLALGYHSRQDYSKSALNILNLEERRQREK